MRAANLVGPIAEALRRDGTVVTTSPRASRFLHLAWAQQQQASGFTVWTTPAILDWDTWIRDLWRSWAFAHPDAPLLLTPLQERALWIRSQRDDAAQVVSPDALATLAMEAWDLLSTYGAHAARRYAWEQVDAERFRHWAVNFERECERRNWITASQLPGKLTDVAAELHLRSEIFLTGFDRIRPSQRTLLERFAARGLVIEQEVLPPLDPKRTWIAASDGAEEIAACALWTRGLLAADPATRIGIIVPSLGSVRSAMERAFRHTLMPGTEDIRTASAAMPFEFSLGAPLADTPLVRAALLILRWLDEPLAEASISWLLLSGFIADTAVSAVELAHYDARQRAAASLASARSLADYSQGLPNSGALAGLRSLMERLLQTVQANPLGQRERSPSSWSELVHRLLESAAWPGSRSADSVQFQTHQRWDRLLDDLALLDIDGSACTYSQFLRLLEKHAEETIFAPESLDAPIQIMGPFASSGQRFDALWFMGTDDRQWPAGGRFHPLLPAAVQREYSMPHATQTDDWNLARAVTARLLASAPNIVFSYVTCGSEAPLRPSPLIAALFPEETTPRSAEALLSASPARRPVLETITDDSGALPWPAERTAGGGADLLRRQAACPFQAFAAKRLGAEPLEAMEWGLSPSDRGNLLHQILQRLFTAGDPAPLRTRDDLAAALAAGTLSTLLDVPIDAALHEYAGQFAGSATDPWTHSYLASEKRRLRLRLLDWLTCEAGRRPFTVAACEQRLPSVPIAGLRLNLRADRIDRLPDGSHLLIDYKSGEVSTGSWWGDRPEEPQLPLYAAYGNVENLSGVLFAQIRAGKTGFHGRVRDAQSQLCAELSSRSALVRDPFTEAMREGWKRVLDALAAEFLQGHAAVDPTDKACERCSLHGLCRVAELDLVPSAAGSEDARDV